MLYLTGSLAERRVCAGGRLPVGGSNAKSNGARANGRQQVMQGQKRSGASEESRRNVWPGENVMEAMQRQDCGEKLEASLRS